MAVEKAGQKEADEADDPLASISDAQSMRTSPGPNYNTAQSAAKKFDIWPIGDAPEAVQKAGDESVANTEEDPLPGPEIRRTNINAQDLEKSKSNSSEIKAE